jgi:hypothetical protein
MRWAVKRRIMKIIKIEEGKVDKMSEYAEKMLKYGGKLMSCIEELSEGGYGERDDEDDDFDDDDMGMRENYNRGNNRSYREDMGMRRSRRTGRYIR